MANAEAVFCVRFGQNRQPCCKVATLCCSNVTNLFFSGKFGDHFLDWMLTADRKSGGVSCVGQCLVVPTLLCEGAVGLQDQATSLRSS